MSSERREAALRAAVRAVEAARASSGEFRGKRPDEVLEERLGPFDWGQFDSPGYRLLRDVLQRARPDRRAGGSADAVKKRGAGYEDRYSRARDRISRVTA